MQDISNLLAQHGLALVFANVLLTQIGLPLPAVPVLMVAGAFVAQGEIALVPLLLAAVAASLLGDTPWYFAGRHYGSRILRALCRIAIEPDSCVRQTENLFERWGAPSLLVAKFIPGFATVAPPLAGTLRLGFGRFAVYSALGALLWAVLPVAAGALFRAEIEWVLGRLQAMGTGALWLIGAVILGYASIKAIERYLLIRFLRMVRVSVAELRKMLEQGARPVILDARSEAMRRLDPRRIPGAIAVDLEEPERYLSRIPPDRDVVVYCS
jgi:membrane protein DedA with SNARE-associated domain